MLLWGICAAVVASCLADDADGSRLFNPFGGGHDEAIEAGLCSKRVELHTVKRGVVKTLPEAEELDGIAVAHPVLYGETRVIAVTVAGNVGQRDVLVAVVFGVDAYINALHMQYLAFNFAHSLYIKEFMSGYCAAFRVQSHTFFLKPHRLALHY